MLEVARFLQKSLRREYSFPIQQEYPSLFNRKFGGVSLIEKVNHQIVSHVGYVVKEYRHRHFQAKVGMIGSVVTDKQYQGRGFASRLLKQALHEMSQQGVDIVVLWSDKPEFYEKLGFVKAGQELDFVIDSQKKINSTLSARKLHLENDLRAVFQLYSENEFQVLRTLEEMKAFLSIPEVQCYVMEQSGVIASYLCVNKGADFTGVIHEWGGDTESLRENILYCQSNVFVDKSLALIAPFSKANLIFDSISISKSHGILGLMQILNKKWIINSYLKWNQFLESSPIVTENELWKLEPQSLVTVCFGQGKFTKGNPLPFFLWGFDSI